MLQYFNMSAEKLYPYAGDHAIQTVAFALEWQGDLNTNALLAVQKLAPKLKEFLPDHQLQNVVSINFEAAQAARSKVTEDVGSVVFSRPTYLGIPRSMTVSRQNCVVIVPDYTRWDTVWAEVQQYLALVWELITKHKPITAIGLQYTDLFHWRADPNELDLREVFLTDTPFLPTNVFDKKGLWHSHHGYLDQYEEPIKHARLENINVTMLETAGERSIQVLTSHKVTLAEPLWKATKSGQKGPELVAEILQDLHGSNKEILKKLLSQEVCKKINLVD